MSISFNTRPSPNGLATLQLAWAGEDRLAVSTNAGLQLYNRRGELLAFHPDDFGRSISCPPSGDFVRYINGGVRDWNWKEQMVTPVADIDFLPFHGTFDCQGNYVCCGESGLDVGGAAVYNKHGEKLEQYGLMYRAKRIALSPDQSKVAFCTSNGLVEIFSFPKNSTTYFSFYTGGPVMAAAWSASGRYLAVALVHGWMEIWDMTSMGKVGAFPGIPSGKWHLWMNMAFVPGSDHLILAGSRRDTCLFDWRQGHILKKHPGQSFDISPSGEWIALFVGYREVMISRLEEYLLHEDS